MICSPRVMQMCSWALTAADVTCRRVPREGRPVHIDRQTDRRACVWPLVGFVTELPGRKYTVDVEGPRRTRRP